MLWNWLFPTAACVAIALIGFQLVPAARAAIEHPAYHEPTDAEREERYREVRHAVDAIDVVRPGAVETATFLLGEAKAIFERVCASSRDLESKATTLLGIVVGASGALGLFGASHGSSAIIASPTILGALAFIVIAILNALYVLRAKRVDNPEVVAYISAAMIRADNRLGLALILAKRYCEMALQLRSATQNELRALLVAHTATATAAVLVLLNAAAAVQGRPSP